jgi:hypothetical protein
MSYLYNFGLSQEDERSEARALDLRPADRVLSGATTGEDWAPALRGWLRQRFSSSLYAITRTGGPQPPEGSLSNPYLDLSII